ncbi:MAG TPA: Type 1 glutamine amidotransferase-like domain-containing protein [Ohtaekwangia sp.]|nr:Type 1 glutamine amidotransferase-like domain-containing protein [Ohtaekwangia sp.]
MWRQALTIFIALWLGLQSIVIAQGKIVLVGGGSESEGGWSDTPYAWAVEHSANKKVAVISYADETNFIPDYFVALGAVTATNFKIDSRAVADLQSTYDALVEYDVFFFKGGDQYVYYDHYRNTKTAQAIIDKFNAGGVIAGTSAGMAILSGVIFTAEHGSVYPDETLGNFRHNNIALADDFLPLFPGYIFDSHFTERGRVGRLLPFIGNWFLETGEHITGIGVDDRTALCINEDKTGYIFGTGSVSVYNAADFSSVQDKLVADSIHVIQLLHGHAIHLPSLEILSGPTEVTVPLDEEDGNYEVILSGSEGLSSNTGFMNYFVETAGSMNDTIVVVTAPGKGDAFIQRLEALHAKYRVLHTNTANDPGQIELRNAIRKSKKVLFVENDDNALFNFLKGGVTGELLTSHIRRNGMITGFIGEDSRYAGKVWVSNHRDEPLAAYYGELNYNDGLDLLHSTVIMPNTYDASNTDFYENTTAAVSFALVSHKLQYGIYLNRRGYLKLFQQSQHNHFQANGDLSSMVMINHGTTTALASQPVNGSGDVRNYVGFSSIQYVLLDGAATLPVGTAHPSDDAPYVFEIPVVGVEEVFDRPVLALFPNPSVDGIFHLSGNIPTLATLSVTDVIGRRLIQETCCESNTSLDLSAYPDGMYLVNIRLSDKIHSLKVFKSVGYGR